MVWLRVTIRNYTQGSTMNLVKRQWYYKLHLSTYFPGWLPFPAASWRLYTDQNSNRPGHSSQILGAEFAAITVPYFSLGGINDSRFYRNYGKSVFPPYLSRNTDFCKTVFIGAFSCDFIWSKKPHHTAVWCPKYYLATTGSTLAAFARNSCKSLLGLAMWCYLKPLVLRSIVSTFCTQAGVVCTLSYTTPQL